MPSDPSPPAAALPTPKGRRMPILMLILGLLLGTGGASGYFLLMPRAKPEVRTVMTRFLLPVPVATCKQVMVLGFRAAGFQNVTPDAGEDLGVGAPGDTISGAALCMPALGAASVAMSSADPALLLRRIQAFGDAVAATNFGPQSAGQPRR